MLPAKDPDLLLKTLQEHEVLLGRLYRTFAGMFAMKADFWTGLANEESEHAGCIKALRDQLKADPDIVIMERFAVDTIHHSMDYIRGEIERAERGDFTLVSALSMAMKLEEALIEKEFFTVLNGDSEQTRAVMTLLARETQKHYEHIRDTYRQISGK